MSGTRRWKISISIDEKPDNRSTTARAQLACDDGHRLTGLGTATRFPRDPQLPNVGDELAVARALDQLAQQLTASAYDEIDDVGRPLWDDT